MFKLNNLTVVKLESADILVLNRKDLSTKERDEFLRLVETLPGGSGRKMAFIHLPGIETHAFDLSGADNGSKFAAANARTELKRLLDLIPDPMLEME